MAFDDYRDDVYEAIKAYLTANWTVTPIAWPNDPFDKPSSGAWVDVELIGTLYGQQSIGTSRQADNRWDEEGILWLHVMARTSRGGSAARGAAKALANLFRGLTLLNGSLEFLDASIGAGQASTDDGNYWGVSTSIEWRRMDS